MHRTGDLDIDVGGSRYIAQQIPGAKYVELPGRDHLWFVGDTEAILGEIEEFLTGVRRAAEFDRVLATVMFTDIADSTAIAADLGDSRWRALVESHNSLVRRELDLHRGREVDSAGDGFLVHFDGPARAIRCASAIVDGAARLGLGVRAGVHTGECEVAGGKLPYTLVPESWQPPRRAKLSCRARCETWLQGPVFNSLIAVGTS